MDITQLFLFSHQCSVSYLEQANITSRDSIVLMLPASMDTRYSYHHHRLVFHHSVVEHFAEELQQKGLDVVVAREADVNAIIATHAHPTAVLTFVRPIDVDVQEELKGSLESRNQPVRFFDDGFFYLSSGDVHAWFSSESKWKMANFYTMMRQRFHILMDQGKPVEGKYSFDTANRKRAPKGYRSTPPVSMSPDAITQAVIKRIQTTYPDHPQSETTFHYAVTSAKAKDALDHFVQYELANFGMVQDAMLEGNPFMSHSLLSLYMNNGLLHPKEVVTAAETAYHDGLASIESVEGFIRQILGWREYIRGVYQEQMPHYKTINTLNNTTPLPAWFWTADTSMNCLHQTIKETIENSYNHHIQRLMILANYANLIGVVPTELSNWFNAMYVDSHDWVVTPNVHGMGLYADGGIMSTKPYISSGNYIHKMSNYCDKCVYDPTIKEGERACPFHSLYWEFIDRHEPLLSSNPRMSLMYKKKKS